MNTMNPRQPSQRERPAPQPVSPPVASPHPRAAAVDASGLPFDKRALPDMTPEQWQAWYARNGGEPPF